MIRRHIHFLQSIDPLYGGGLISSCIELADAQREMGVPVEVWSTNTSTSTTDHLSSYDFLYLAYCVWPKAFLYAPKLTTDFREFEDNGIIHNHGFYMYSSYLATKIKKKNHNSLVQHVHGMFEPWILSRSRWKKAIVNMLFENYKYRKAEYWRALTSKEADQIRSFGVAGKIIVEPNGIDLNPIDDYLFSARKRMQKKFRMGFMGRLHEKKGLKPFIQALQQVNDAIKNDWELVIAGPDEGALSELHSFLNNHSQITWVGELRGSDKYDFLNSLDLFILPSFSEGFSMAVLEACAFKVPVMITDQCNFDEAYVHGAIRLDNNRSIWKNDLTAALSMSESELMERGASLRKLVEKDFSWLQIAKNLNGQLCE